MQFPVVTVERMVTADAINAVVNHPAVLPFVRGPLKGPLDLSDVIADTRNVLLMGEHGGMLFEHQRPGVYEIYTVVLPQKRGRWTIGMAHAALHWMFTRTDAIELVTRCPRGNLGAHALTRAMKGQHQFTAPDGWITDTGPIPAEIYAWSRQRWLRDHPLEYE